MLNCWNPLRDFEATTQVEMPNVNAGKFEVLGNQQPTTCSESLVRVQRLAARRRFQVGSKQHALTKSEDIVCSLLRDRVFGAKMLAMNKNAQPYTCVYRITCLSNRKIYIGISNDYKRRFVEHIYRGMNPEYKREDLKLCRAIRKYGQQSFKVEVLLYGSRSYCGFMEVKLIEAFDSYKNGLNSSSGGEGTEHYLPWNKGTKGVCKPNSTSFTRETKAHQKLTEEEIQRMIEERKQGVCPKHMSWLPVHVAQAYRVLRQRGVEMNLNQKPPEFYSKIHELKMSGTTSKELASMYNVSHKLMIAQLAEAKKRQLTTDVNTSQMQTQQISQIAPQALSFSTAISSSKTPEQVPLSLKTST